METTYYKKFDDETSVGKVFNLDLSSDENVDVNALTKEEKDERNAYIVTVKQLAGHYFNRHSNITQPNVTSQEILLQQRIVAPRLAPENASKRSRIDEPRKSRLYPPTIEVWDAFDADVGAFQPSPSEQLDPRHYLCFENSLIAAKHEAARNESEEQAALLSCLKTYLRASELIGGIGTEGGGGVGKMDFFLFKTAVDEEQVAGNITSDDISVVCESKSTHNLLLPMEVSAIVDKYNKAYATVMIQGLSRTREWSNIAHPLGQLLGYMTINYRRYGALTSGTRTYFVFIDDDGLNGDYLSVKISDAWFVGEPNYLRAWAFIHHQGCHQTPYSDLPASWTEMTKDNQTPQKGPPNQKKDDPDNGDGDGNRSENGSHDGNGDDDDDHGGTDDKKPKARELGPGKRPSESGQHHSGGGRKRRGKGNIEHDQVSSSSLIPHVPFEDIRIVSVIGSGWNGMAFKVRWDGQEVAMKQFDVDRDGDKGYNKEVEAYMRLRAVWGVLVPKPVFLSESLSGGVKFLGLQMGRDPTYEDDLSSWSDLLDRLENDYGIRHNDAKGRNHLFIAGADGKERLVAIDFEDWDEVDVKMPQLISNQ